MYAVVRTGGKQYRVGPGDILEVEKLTGNVGDSVVLDDVLLVSSGNDVRIGQPNVDGASVTAKITGQHRAEKILAFRYRPKKRVRVRRGHRQYLTRLQIHKISGEDFEFVEEVQKVAAPQPVAEEVEPVAAVDEVEAPVAIVADTVTPSQRPKRRPQPARKQRPTKPPMPWTRSRRPLPKQAMLWMRPFPQPTRKRALPILTMQKQMRRKRNNDYGSQKRRWFQPQQPGL